MTHRLPVVSVLVALMLMVAPAAEADHADDRILPPDPTWIEALAFTPQTIDGSHDTSEPIEVGFHLKVATTCADFHFEAECDSWRFGIRNIEVSSPSGLQVARGTFKFTSSGHAHGAVTFPADPEPGTWQVALLDVTGAPSSGGGFAYTNLVPAGSTGQPWQIANFPDTEAVQTEVVVLAACDGCGQDELTVVSQPTISGTARVGYTLTGVPGSFSDGVVTNQWFADGTPITGATDKTLLLADDLEGAVVTFTSTATRGDDTLSSVSDPIGPIEPAEKPDEGDLVEGTRGVITVLPEPTITLGDNFRVDVGLDYLGQQVRVLLFSDPLNLGTAQVTSSGKITLTMPSNAPTGNHRLAVYDVQGQLIGWQPVTLTRPSDTNDTNDTNDATDATGAAADSGDNGSDALPNVGTSMSPFIALSGLLLLTLGTVLVTPRRSRRPLPPENM